MQRILLGLCCLMAAGAALAAGPRADRGRMQASMLVTGSITVAPDGSVKNYEVDHPGQLPPEVVSLIERNVPLWRFLPVLRDGRPVFAKATMSLRVLARPVGEHQHEVSIGGTNFGRPSANDEAAGKSISYKQRRAPGYPMAAVQARVSGTVYLLLAINPQGLVDKAAAEQVNLDVLGGDHEMSRWRSMLANAATGAAREWTFNVPVAADHAAAADRLVRVPVTFRFTTATRQYGSWHLYVPGPRVIPAWAGRIDAGDSADAVGDDHIVAPGEGLHLAKPLGSP